MSKDGGPAFPAQPIQRFGDGSEITVEQGGMTLRDWFAGQALAGMTASTDEISGGWASDAVCARACYGLADAMLAERDK